MLRSQGIDANIGRTMDAFRGKEGQLQARYKKSQQLIDLLALQKLKSEQDAKSREIQLSQEKNPATVKQQMETEMLERSRQEVVKQTSGLLGQAQKKKQQNMQAQGQQPPSPPVGIERMMAAGGPVKFDKGEGVPYPGGVTQDQIDAYRKKLNPRSRRKLTDEEIAERINNPSYYGVGGGFSEARKEFQAKERRRIEGGEVSSPEVEEPKLEYSPSPSVTPNLQVGTSSLSKTPSNVPPSVTPSNVPPSVTPMPKAQNSLEETLGIKTDEMRANIPTKFAVDPDLEAQIKKLAGQNPDKTYETSVARGKALGLDPTTIRTDFEDLATKRREKTEGIEGELKKLYGNPEQNEREQYLAMLAGGAGGGRSLADLGRGMYKGRMGTRDKQRENRRANLLTRSELLDKEIELSSKGIERGVEAGKSLFDNATSAANTTQNSITGSTQAWANMDATKRAAMDKQADRLFTAISEENKSKIALETKKLQQLDIESRDNATAVTAATSQLTSINKIKKIIREDAITEIETQFTGYTLLKAQEAQGKLDEEGKIKLEEIENRLNLIITKRLSESEYGNIPQIESAALEVIKRRAGGLAERYGTNNLTSST